MTIDVLVCRPDGTQVVERQEVPDNYFDPGSGERIADLKRELEETDYKIIKCSEYQIAGLPLPYDIEELHAERQALRDRIGEIESEE